MNIYDIAKMSGVSIATVSRVLNGSDKVSEKTRRRVMEVIEKEGYTPNVFAQGLGLNTMHTVGILVPDISDLYMSSAVSFLENCLTGYGYGCILGCSGFQTESKIQHVQMLLSKKIDGLILVGSTYAGGGASPRETDYIREAAAQVPIFVINGAVQGENVFSAVCEDRAAVREVTEELIRRGRKRILFLTDSDSYSAREKMAGYEDALREAGLPVLGELKMKLRNRIHVTRDLLLQYRNLGFDAVIATDDGMAVGAVKYAAARGLRVPEDLSIVGYNNSSLAVACEPELTSIDNRMEEVCRETVEMLMQTLKGEGNGENGGGAGNAGGAGKTAPRGEKAAAGGAGKHFSVTCRIVKRSTTDF